MSARVPAPEGPEVEWKVRLARPDRVAATLSAFANGRGGTLCIGVRDDGFAAGVEDVPAVRAELRRIAREWLEPPQPLRLRTANRDGRTLVFAAIDASPANPVAAARRSGELVIFVRDGSSSRPASRDEIARLARRAPSLGTISPEDRRVLRAIARMGTPRAAELARALHVGSRTLRRRLVPLLEAGLVLENEGRRLWLTPDGHARMAPQSGGAR